MYIFVMYKEWEIHSHFLCSDPQSLGSAKSENTIAFKIACCGKVILKYKAEGVLLFPYNEPWDVEQADNWME